MFGFFERVKSVWHKKQKKYALWISPIAFGLGFVLDLFTLNRIDQKFDLTILLIHMSLATGWIGLWHLNRSSLKKFRKRKKLKALAKRIAPAAMQFSFGALFSGFVIFYTKSSSILISWPFLIVLYILFFGNESFRKFYRGLFFQIGVLYFSVLTMLIFLVPLWVKDIGTDIFLLSGLLSLLVIGVVFRVLVYWFRSVSTLDHKRLWLWIFMIWMGVNILYYENLIPAIPLSLKSDELYYHIERTDDGYEALAREQGFWERVMPPDRIEKPDGEWIYYYSAIFAPSSFHQQIIHRWEYFSPRHKRWIKVYEYPLQIVGGRGDGYRGYSYLVNPALGKWRVLVQTNGAQILGQKVFEIIAPEGEVQMRSVEF